MTKLKCHWCKSQLKEIDDDSLKSYECGYDSHILISLNKEAQEIISYLAYIDIKNIRYKIRSIKKYNNNTTEIYSKNINALAYMRKKFSILHRLDFSVMPAISNSGVIEITNNFVERINKLKAFY